MALRTWSPSVRTEKSPAAFGAFCRPTPFVYQSLATSFELNFHVCSVFESACFAFFGSGLLKILFHSSSNLFSCSAIFSRFIIWLNESAGWSVAFFKSRMRGSSVCNDASQSSAMAERICCFSDLNSVTLSCWISCVSMTRRAGRQDARIPNKA